MTTDGFTITHDLIAEGLAEINAWPDDDGHRMKDPHRTLLADLLGEDIPTGPMPKAQWFDLLTRARNALPR